MCARVFPPQSPRRGGYDPPDVSLSHPPQEQISFARRGFFSCVRFPGDSAGRSGTGPYGKGGKLERRAAHSRPYAATLVKCSHNRPLIGCTPQDRPHPPPFCTVPSVWYPFFRRGAQRAPAGSRRSHPAGADIIRPMFRRPAQLPPHNALSRPLWAAQFPQAFFSPPPPKKGLHPLFYGGRRSFPVFGAKVLAIPSCIG